MKGMWRLNKLCRRYKLPLLPPFIRPFVVKNPSLSLAHLLAQNNVYELAMRIRLPELYLGTARVFSLRCLLFPDATSELYLYITLPIHGHTLDLRPSAAKTIALGKTQPVTCVTIVEALFCELGIQALLPASVVCEKWVYACRSSNVTIYQLYQQTYSRLFMELLARISDARKVAISNTGWKLWFSAPHAAAFWTTFSQSMVSNSIKVTTTDSRTSSSWECLINDDKQEANTF